MLHQLSDGTPVLIRPIRPDDAPRLERSLRRLSEETIRRRFLATKPRFTKRDLDYLTRIDGHDHIALVAVLPETPNQIVATARAVRLQDRPDTAEMAVVVADFLQGHGLGSLLAERLAAVAQAHGIRRFAGTMLAENEAARRLIAHIARQFEDDHYEGGLREVVVELAAA